MDSMLDSTFGMDSLMELELKVLDPILELELQLGTDSMLSLTLISQPTKQLST